MNCWKYHLSARLITGVVALAFPPRYRNSLPGCGAHRALRTRGLDGSAFALTAAHLFR